MHCPPWGRSLPFCSKLRDVLSLHTICSAAVRLTRFDRTNTHSNCKGADAKLTLTKTRHVSPDEYDVVTRCLSPWPQAEQKPIATGGQQVVSTLAAHRLPEGIELDRNAPR